MNSSTDIAARIPVLFPKGDKQAFRYIFDTQLNPLCYFAEKIIGQREDAEDIVSRAFSKLWERYIDFSSIQSIRSFLYTTVRNQCLDYLKHRKVVGAAEKHLIGAPSENVIESTMYQAELFEIVYQELQLLPEKYGRILKLSFLEEYSGGEIAELLGMSEVHVRVEKYRGLVMLRKALRKKRVWGQVVALLLLW